MAFRKPTVDDYRIQTAVDNAFGPAAMTVCAWVRFDVLAANASIYYGINSNIRGCWLRPAGTGGLDLNFGYVKSTGSNVFTTHSAHGISAGEWAFWYGVVDASGNIRVGVNGAFTTASDGAPRTTGDVVTPTLLNKYDGSNNEAQATIADFRFYDRALPQAELNYIEHRQGKAIVVDGLVSHLPLWDGAPGVDTDTALPMDAAEPGRSWVAAGTGDAYTWEGAPYPLQRAA